MRHKHRWYCKPFIQYETNSHKISVPFKKTWFYPAKWIQNYNMQNCLVYYPDWQDGDGTKVKPFLGYVLKKPEGEAPALNWWKYLKKYRA